MAKLGLSGISATAAASSSVDGETKPEQKVSKMEKKLRHRLKIIQCQMGDEERKEKLRIAF